MAKLRLVSIDGCDINTDKGEVRIKNILLTFDEPEESPSLRIDLLEALEIALEQLKTGKVVPKYVH